MSVVTITGSNDFARRNAVRELVDAFVSVHGELALERIDGEETEFTRIQEALTSLPFLVNKKLVLFLHPSATTHFADKAEQLLAELPDTTELLLVEPKFDKRSGLYKLLKKQADFREYEQLDAAKLTQWLVDRAQAKDATLSLADARYLTERVGQNQQLLSGELDKLVLFSPKITKETINELTDRTPQSTIFELIETAFSGDRKHALELYDDQRKLKVEPIQIIAMFSWQLHVLALLVAAEGRSADAVASEAKLSPYTVKKTQRIAANLDLSRVRKLINELVTLDARSKRESIDLDEALRNYILQLG